MGDKDKKYTTGYRYFLGVQFVVCLGAIDKITRVIIGERVAWDETSAEFGADYPVTENGNFLINNLELFGGDSREGGVGGQVTLSLGDTDTQNPYLVEKCGEHVPAYVGLTTLTFGDLPGGLPGSGPFFWSAMNPYFKAPWVETTRILRGWRDNVVLIPDKAQIGDFDMNPAHIIFQCLTDDRFGMGASSFDMDVPSFVAAANILYDEGFGLSLIWDQQSSIESFIQMILSHINGSLRMNLTTGQFSLILIRDDYDVDTLVELNESNTILNSFQRVGYGELANEIVVKYTDRNQDDQSVNVQDLAVIEAQGAIISATKEYPGIREQALAARVAARDLKTSSSPLAKITATTNRVIWNKTVGDVVALTWPKLGIHKAAFRIVAMDKGTLLDGKITIDAIEDIFGLPDNAYTGDQGSNWVDPVTGPVPVTTALAIEAPYWDVIRTLSAADFAALTPGYAFGEVVAVEPPIVTYGYELWEAPDFFNYDFAAIGYFAPSGLLQTDISYTTASISLTNTTDLSDITLGTYGILDGEYVSVLGVDTTTNVITVGRGVLDTVPKPHAAGSRFYFAEGNLAYDTTEYLEGGHENYKPLTRTPLGVLKLADATALPLDFIGRADMPYPPGNFKVNTVSYPVDAHGPISITWSHRDRLSQTVALVPYSIGNIGPEAGVIYLLKITGESAVLYDSTVDGTSYSISFETEKLLSGKTDRGTTRDMRNFGLNRVISSLSTALNSHHYFLPVGTARADWMGGWFGGVPYEARYITSAAVVTTQPFLSTWNDNVQQFSLKAGVYPSMINPDPYVGWGISVFDPAGIDPISDINFCHDAVYNPIQDRRSDPDHMFYVCVRSSVLVYFPQSRAGNRRLYCSDNGLRIIKSSEVLTGSSVPVTRTAVDNYYFGDTTQFNDFTNKHLAFPNYTGTFFQNANANIAIYNERTYRTIIFGSLLYYAYIGPGTTVNTAGKTIDMTNILNAHIDVAGDLVDKTKVYSVSAGGVLALLTTRSGAYLADQVTSTLGVEILGSAMFVLNITTGVQTGSIGTLPAAAYTLCGDVPNNCFYVVCANNFIYKYDITGTLLASLGGLVGLNTNQTLKVSLNKVYLHSVVEIDKALTSVKYNEPFTTGEGVTEMFSTRPDSSISLANWNSSSTIIKGLVDDGGLGGAILNGPTARVNDTITVELGSVRGSTLSYTKHNFTTKRQGMGLRMGESMGG